MSGKSKCRLSKKKAERVLDLLKYLTSLKKSRQETAIKFISDEGLEYISETIFNILYNPDCTSLLSKSKKSKLIKTLKPNSFTFRNISNKQYPITTKRKKITQFGSGIPLLLSAAIPFLVSLLTPKK